MHGRVRLRYIKMATHYLVASQLIQRRCNVVAGWFVVIIVVVTGGVSPSTPVATVCILLLASIRGGRCVRTGAVSTDKCDPV